MAIAGVPEGLGAETSASAVVLGIVASIIVLLRTWVRIRNGAIGGDDYLMIIALIFFIPCCVITFLGCLSGIGETDDVIKEQDTSGEINKNGLRWFFLFWVVYMCCLPFIKSSICVALLRIAKAKHFVIPIWIVMGLSIFGAIIGLASQMEGCKPIAANWDIALGHCRGTEEVGAVTIFVSAISILTDWLCAILPALLLWNLNMKTKTKVLLAFVLALGALASISTCIRLRYMHIYKDVESQPKDLLQRAARLIVWSIVECGIGIIAGSLPPLQPLFRRFGLRIGSSRMKLTCEPHPGESHVLSYYRQKNVPPTAPAAAVVRPARPRNMAGGSQGNSLVTTCSAEANPYQHWWHTNSQFDDVSNKKLIIVKNTRIEIEYDVEREAYGPLR
nr:C252A protein [Hypoxylon sp. CO27-5]